MLTTFVIDDKALSLWPGKKGNKWEKILIGGGTFSAHPLTAAAGLAMLHYLKEHRKEVYPLLEETGKKVRKGVQKALDQEGVDAVVTGIGSLFQTHFPLQKGTILNSPQSINKLTNVEKREVEFRIRMLTKGVHMMHGGGGVTIAHSDKDIKKIIESAREVAREMMG